MTSLLHSKEAREERINCRREFKTLPNIYDKLFSKIGSYCSELLLNVCPIYKKESLTEIFLIKLSGLRSATSENVDLKSNNHDISSAAV